MSLKIKISKPSIASESRPAKRRIQRIESDEDVEANTYESAYDPPAEGSRRKKSRTTSRIASGESGDDDYADADADVDVDVDIDGDIEDTRFLPEPPPLPIQAPSPVETRRRLSSAGASSSKSRHKESKSTKSKSSSKKPRRQVVWTDDEDEEFDDPDVVVTDDDDFDPEPDHASRKGGKGKSAKSAAGKFSGKSKNAKEKEREEKEITFRDERKLPSSIPARSSKPQDSPPKPAPSLVPDPLEGLNLQPKRKLPPIKKNKPSTAGSTAPSTPSTAKAIPAAAEKKDSHLTPAPTSNQVGTRKPAGASADLNLLDSSVYSELFKSAPGTSTPNSGLNRKQKEEERKRELNRMREEARAKREAEARSSFDLQAAPEKIERFVLSRLRGSTARYPNVLGAAFKEMYERSRAPPPTGEQR
ncbi:hypothetical protein GY45DRAFT_530334 [Cubamyces sp. BRFM 1775]|nr:hypothetical protein GY45DRAFT_530334 [Cubamyces sp. BRFM 1775]